LLVVSLAVVVETVARVLREVHRLERDPQQQARLLRAVVDVELLETPHCSRLRLDTLPRSVRLDLRETAPETVRHENRYLVGETRRVRNAPLARLRTRPRRRQHVRKRA